MKTNLTILFISLILVACSSTKNISYIVNYPALIDLPIDWTKVGVINRSVPFEGENSTLNKIDELLSAEGLKLDYKGSEASISQMINALNQQE